ncbi:MAG: Clp protease N-terminal domain-containing protein [Candidatus Dormiibacterota bacterium]
MGISSPDNLRINTTAELLKAVELGIVDKTEARSMLGLGVKRGRLAKLQNRDGGRFAKGMVLPFNRFSDDAKAAMLHGQERATKESRDHVTTDDLLLGLLQRGGSPAGIALASLAVSLDKVESAIAGLSQREQAAEGIGTTAELKSVVESAFESVEYPEEIGSAELLLALAEGDGTAAAALRQLGVSADAIRAAVEGERA